MFVCNLYISRTIHPNYFTFGRFVADDSRKCSVEFGAIRTYDTFSIINVILINKCIIIYYKLATKMAKHFCQTIYYISLNYDTEYLSNLNKILFVCNSHISRVIHPISFTFGRFVAEDSVKCSVQFGVIWTCNTFTINKLWICSEASEHALCSRGGAASALMASWLCR